MCRFRWNHYRIDIFSLATRSGSCQKIVATRIFQFVCPCGTIHVSRAMTQKHSYGLNHKVTVRWNARPFSLKQAFGVRHLVTRANIMFGQRTIASQISNQHPVHTGTSCLIRKRNANLSKFRI